MLKYKLLPVMILLVLLTGCKTASRSQMPPEQKLAQTQTATPFGLNRIILVNARTPVKRGENCSVTIQGRAEITYTIAASYKIGDKILTTYESRMAGSDGMVTWIWAVSSDTVPGTYGITISGGGMDFQTAYTVTE